MAGNPVLIVGAGPTGLVLAIELARRGVPLHLADRHPEPLRWDRATTVKARSLEVFSGMGFSGHVRSPRPHRSRRPALFGRVEGRIL